MNFTFNELYNSDVADIYDIDNRPYCDDTITNLMRLTVDVLQPLRDSLGKPIIVTSGYRSKVINDLVKGVWNSQHLTGQAVDIVVNGMSVSDVMAHIIKLKLPFDQLINEYNKWTHISLREKNNRKEILNYGKK